PPLAAHTPLRNDSQIVGARGLHELAVEAGRRWSGGRARRQLCFAAAEPRWTRPSGAGLGPGGRGKKCLVLCQLRSFRGLIRAKYAAFRAVGAVAPAIVNLTVAEPGSLPGRRSSDGIPKNLSLSTSCRTPKWAPRSEGAHWALSVAQRREFPSEINEETT